MEAAVKQSSYKGLTYIVDTFMVLLNLSTSYSLIPYLVFRRFDRYENMIMLIILNLIFIALRFRGGNECDEQQETLINRNYTLIKLYTAISIVCFISGITTGTGGASTLVYMVLNLEFYWILCKLFDEYLKAFSIRDSFYLLIRGYKVLVLLSLFGCVIMFIYLKMGGDPYRNPIGLKYDLFWDNAVNFNSQYYFPFHICVVDVHPDIRIPFFQEAGLLEGLYHEPHCMTFMIFPSLFLLLFYSKTLVKRVFWVLLFLFIVLLEGSTTNIGSVLIALLVYSFYTFKSSITKSFALLIALALVVFIVSTYVDLETFSFITKKIEGGSKDYSMSTIDFALHPRTLLGTSFYNLSYIHSSRAAKTMDIGWITFFLNGAFLLLCLGRLIRLFVRKTPLTLAILLFAVYFFVHSTKVAMVSYSLTMLIFVIFLIEETNRFSDELLIQDEETTNEIIEE